VRKGDDDNDDDDNNNNNIFLFYTAVTMQDSTALLQDRPTKHTDKTRTFIKTYLVGRKSKLRSVYLLLLL